MATSGEPMNRMGRALLFLFAMPAVLQGFMHAPAQSLVQGVYAKHTGLSLTALGSALLLTRFFDAVIDPLIGALSDACHRRLRSRKMLIALGTAVTLLGQWFLYRPPADVSIIYFTGWFMMTYLGWTLTEIPYRAWSMELSSDYVFRSRIQVWLGVALLIGALSFYAVPYIQKALGLSRSTEFDLSTMAVTAAIVVVVFPIVNLLALWRLPDGPAHCEAPPIGLRDLGSAIGRNPPLLYFIFVFAAFGISGGLGQGVYYLYFDSYLGLGKHFAAVFLLALPVSVIAIPFWGWVSQHFERRSVWAITLAAGGLCYCGLGFIEPGPNALTLATVCVISTCFFVSSTLVIGMALLGDAIDYGRWRFGQDHAGLYMASYTLLQKFAGGLGVALGLMILGWLGFDPTARAQSASASTGMKLIVSWLPGACCLLISPMVWRFPITRGSHARMMAEIAARDGSILRAEPQ